MHELEAAKENNTRHIKICSDSLFSIHKHTSATDSDFSQNQEGGSTSFQQASTPRDSAQDVYAYQESISEEESEEDVEITRPNHRNESNATSLNDLAEMDPELYGLRRSGRGGSGHVAQV